MGRLINSLIIFSILLAVLPLVLITSCEEEIYQEYPRKVVYHLGAINWDSAQVAEASKAELMVLSIDRAFNPVNKEYLEALREYNPNIKIIAHYTLLGRNEFWNYPDTVGYDKTWPWLLDIYHTTRPHWAKTSTGDTLHYWPDCVFLNYYNEDCSGLNYTLMNDMVDIFAEYNEEYGLDGVFFDYIMDNIFISPYVSGDVDGEIDMNKNGVAQDSSERFDLVQWQWEYINKFRDRFGEDFIMVANGRFNDYTISRDGKYFRDILNGKFYEKFPKMMWGRSERNGFEDLIDEGSYARAFGKRWTILGCYGQDNYFGHAAANLTGVLVAESTDDSKWREWYYGYGLGKAEGTIYMPEGGQYYSRKFEDGIVEMRFIGEDGTATILVVDK